MSSNEAEICNQAARLGELLIGKKLKLAGAESCTGGWLAKIITDIPGSSSWFETSIVSYSNEAKHRLLGVNEDTLNEHGAVSELTVREMVAGLFERTSADVAVSISGIAGPGGGSEDKPVGLVWLCWGERNKEPTTESFHFDGDREQVRLQSVQAALQGLLDQVSDR